ncbi:MAG: valine--tRNA ligase [Bacteriovoracaceae bacterium]|nr:valine--tRNA ligase [Bacteriovoracaceae bacterium]
MATKDLPKKYKSIDTENKWLESWEKEGVYKYDPEVPRSDTYVIDTPPPTVSGSLHVGHVFSYTQTDIVARYQRMQGKNIFYPIGWDDNGLPTERRVQTLYGIRCNPTLPYDDSFQLKKAKSGSKDQKEVSRKNFLEACQTQTGEDEKKYEALWRHLGLSFDWQQQYETINDHCRKISQASFLDLKEKGFVYSSKSPTMWDTTYQTAVAQAEVEERDKSGHYHDITFKTDTNEEFVISTTRPELLAACIAVVAHPEDERYQHLFGKHAYTPLFNVKVPIMKAEHADPEKGTGILMVCTFGDTADVDFWKQSDLPLKQIIGRGGKLIEITFGEDEFTSEDPEAANKVYSELVGLYAKQAKRKMAELLKEDGSLVGEPRPTEQIAKFYEKGEQPLEFISTRQWFIKILENKSSLIEQGKKIQWHPEHMFKRYEQWVEGLNQDWCISRQRFFGVPFPVWYKLNEEGEPDYNNPIFATEDMLPVDPQMETAPGFEESQRGQANGFMGDPDVMDTWATSSVSPQVSSHWKVDQKRHESLFPADLRPQAHEIIRTWAFYTITKSWMHEKKVPWHNIAISGWVVNPDRKKMSKSKGNTVTPEDLMTTYSSDALRYWAGKARLGQDTIYDENVFKIGQRLGTKIFNASKFVMMQLEDENGTPCEVSLSDITEPIDMAWTTKMNKLIEDTTKSFNKYDYNIVLSNVEASFWEFCDLYLELVKTRAYKQRELPSGKSAQATLEWTLKTFLKLFAPFLPYISEEVWSWNFASKEDQPSIHRAPWPVVETGEAFKQPSTQLIDLAKEIMMVARGEKSTQQKSLRWPIEKMEISGTKEHLEAFKLFEGDIVLAANLKGNPVTSEISEKPSETFFDAKVTLSETKE